MGNNQSIYIPSIEASDLYLHMVRDTKIKLNYVGMIPYSLELIKLRKEMKRAKLSTFRVKTSDKELSDVIINVKFKQKVSSAEEIIQKLKKKINKLNDDKEEYKKKLQKFVTDLEKEKHLDKWKETSNENLREYLYLNGFTITDVEGNQAKYIVYKRSSSKSRTGQCLFIREELHEEMINWSRMYLPFERNVEIDYAGLLAYESLVLSSLEDTIRINPKNILIVDDVNSKFIKKCNVVRKNFETGYLDSFKESVEISNSLFDGESLLDSKYFANGQAMKLLRNHMFKSAAFNTNLQEFLKDNCPDHIPFEEWRILDMFNYPVPAKDIELIITPSSLKALKFSHVLDKENTLSKIEQQKRMWNYWQELVDKEDWTFGVCKHEKQSKLGVKDGKPLQQMSYQMINSLPMTKEDISILSTYEKEYINRLKNDDTTFIQYIKDNANDMNSNMMFADLYKRNKSIVNTKLFRDFRKSEINKYVTHIKKGKVRLNGDYCVMLGNPMEFLYHAIGKFDVNESKLALNQNQVYTTIFDFDKKLVGFRNPHTSPSNVLITRNTYNEDIDTYFNLSDNIVCVNAVNFEIQDILSGSDYDSDTVLLFDSMKLLEISNKCFGKYPVCINKVESQKKTYKLNNTDMCKIDNQLATSQIGEVVNLGQLCMSRYWDLKEKGSANQKILDALMRKVDVMTVLSGIAIDMAKKFYEIDIENEIDHVEESLKLKNKWIKDKKGSNKTIEAKPLFFKYISQSKTIKNRVVHYNCSMDFLYQEMNKLEYADHHENLDFSSLLVKHDKRKGNRKQKRKIIDYVDSMNEKINGMFDTYEGKERYNAIEDVVKYYDFFMEKLTVKPETMYSILVYMKVGKLPIKLLNVLYKTQKEVFLNAFIKN